MDHEKMKIIIDRDFERPVVVDGCDEASNYAAGIVSLDDTVADEFRIKKTVVYLEGGKFIIVQKSEADRTLGGELNDGNNESLLVASIPEDYIDKSFRDRIKLKNMLTDDRAKPLELTYNDFVELIDWIEKNPDATQRVSIQQCIDNIRSFDFDRDIANSFDRDSTMFIESAVKDKISEAVRIMHAQKPTTRITPASVTTTALPSSTEGAGVSTKHRCCHLVPDITTGRSQRVKRNFE
jgi:hypothetical protein